LGNLEIALGAIIGSICPCPTNPHNGFKAAQHDYLSIAIKQGFHDGLTFDRD
jgi:hypothetical protein